MPVEKVIAYEYLRCVQRGLGIIHIDSSIRVDDPGLAYLLHSHLGFSMLVILNWYHHRWLKFSFRKKWFGEF